MNFTLLYHTGLDDRTNKNVENSNIINSYFENGGTDNYTEN